MRPWQHDLDIARDQSSGGVTAQPIAEQDGVIASRGQGVDPALQVCAELFRLIVQALVDQLDVDHVRCQRRHVIGLAGQDFAGNQLELHPRRRARCHRSLGPRVHGSGCRQALVDALVLEQVAQCREQQHDIGAL